MDENFKKAQEGLNINNLTNVAFTTPKTEFLQIQSEKLQTYSNKYIKKELSNDYFKERCEKLKEFYKKKY
jgi:hypothetical protein